jgi:ankyrin repeat protein
MASIEGHTEVVKILVDHGADVNACMLLCCFPVTSILTWMIDNRNNGRTALLLASQGGRTEIVEILIDRNADINARGIRVG